MTTLGDHLFVLNAFFIKIRYMVEHIPVQEIGRTYAQPHQLKLRNLGTLIKMYEIRKPMYEAFRDVLIENEGTLDQAAELIWRDFCEDTCYKRP